MVLFGLVSGGGLHAYDFEYDAGDIEGTVTASGVTYTLSVSRGDLGTSCDFDTTQGATSGGPGNIDIKVSPGGATGVIEYGLDAMPTANFAITMNGLLIPPSGGEGSQPTWGASGNAKVPFYIKSDQEGGAKVITVKAGTSVTYTAYEGDSSKNSSWTVNGQTKNNESSIIFNRNWWNVPGWFSASMGTPDPGVYNISASPTDGANKSDSGKMTVVGIEKLQLKLDAGNWEDVEEKYAAYVGDDLQIKAIITPAGATWPSDTPTWEGKVTGAGPGDTRTVDTSKAGKFTVTAECGASEKSVEIELKPVELKIPPAVLRDGKAENPQNTLQIKAGQKKYKLKISVTEGTGAAVFANSKTEMEYTGNASDEWDKVFIQGVLESSEKSNIKITISLDNKEIASVTTIVYSEIKDDFTSSARQHKDSTEECLTCTANGDNVWDTPPMGHTTGLIHSTTFRSLCSHCDSYCAHCCLSILKGGKQDSYRALGTASLTANHNVGLNQYDVAQYMAQVTTTISYGNIYLKFKANPTIRLLAGMKNHAYIIHGVRMNTEAGNVTDGIIFTWEPMNGNSEEHKVSEIVKLHE